MRDLYEKEAKLRRDLEADGLEKKLLIEDLKTSIQLLKTENEKVIESTYRIKNKYLLQIVENDELHAILGEEIGKRIEDEKKHEDLEKILASMEKKVGISEPKPKIARGFKMFEILLKNEFEGRKNVERKDNEVSMIQKLDDNSSGDLGRKTKNVMCFECSKKKILQTKDRGTETLKDFTLLAEEIEKRKKAEKKVLELQMMMSDDETIDTAMEIKVLRDTCEEEAKLRIDLEADGLEKKLQIEQLKMKIKLFDAETKDLKANIHKAAVACFESDYEPAGNVLAQLNEEIEKRKKMENKMQKLEMLLEAKNEKRSTEEAINIVENFTNEETEVEYFEKKNSSVQNQWENGFWFQSDPFLDIRNGF